MSVESSAQSADSPPGEGEVLSRDEIRQRIEDLTVGRTLRSSSGHFLITGTNRAENLSLSGWAEDIAARQERAIGMDNPFESRQIHLVVRSGDTPSGGMVLSSEYVSRGRFVQRLILWNHVRMDVEDARRDLCRLLLAGYLVRTVSAKEAAGAGDAGIRHRVPLWLADGLSQYMDPNLRGPNTVDVVTRWERGQLSSIADFLKADGKVKPGKGGEPESDRSMGAVLVNWLMTHPGRRERFRKIIEHLDSGEAVDSRLLAACMDGIETAGQLEEAWDYWVHGRRQVVYSPGEVTADAVGMLKGGLLLYPGNSGIPLTVDIGKVAGLRDLIGRRDEEWIPGFCARKSRSLSLLAVGRGPDFGAVTALFCEFLDGLKAGKDEAALRNLLKQAENALADLEAKTNGDA